MTNTYQDCMSIFEQFVERSSPMRFFKIYGTFDRKEIKEMQKQKRLFLRKKRECLQLDRILTKQNNKKERKLKI